MSAQSEFKREDAAYVEAFRRSGAEHGRALASWYFDGNTDESTYQAVLKGLQDGDPAVLDTFPSPDFSGQWAGEPSWEDILEDHGVDVDSDASDDYYNEYMDAAWQAIQESIEATCRLQLDGRLCGLCGADIVGNDPHGPTCPNTA